MGCATSTEEDGPSGPLRLTPLELPTAESRPPRPRAADVRGASVALPRTQDGQAAWARRTVRQQIAARREEAIARRQRAAELEALSAAAGRSPDYPIDVEHTTTAEASNHDRRHAVLYEALPEAAVSDQHHHWDHRAVNHSLDPSTPALASAAASPTHTTATKSAANSQNGSLPDRASSAIVTNTTAIPTSSPTANAPWGEVSASLSIRLCESMPPPQEVHHW